MEGVQSTFYYEPAVCKVSTPMKWVFGVDTPPPDIGGCKLDEDRPEITEQIVGLGASIINSYGFITPELSNYATGLKQIIRKENQEDPNPNDERGSNNGCLSEDTPYGSVSKWSLEGGLESPDSPVKSFVEAIYSAPTFPAPGNKFRDAVRKRKNYKKLGICLLWRRYLLRIEFIMILRNAKHGNL